MSKPAKFTVWSFFPEVARNAGPFANAYVLSVVLGLTGLATPLFFQAIIDNAIAHYGFRP